MADGILPLLVISVAIIAVGLSLGGIHKIEEGHLGVYHRGGALIDGTTEPGFHTLIPLLTTVEQVQFTIQTDRVTNIPCGTSGGVLIYFENIEVVNQLKKDSVWQTVKNYTVNYDRTWIFDKIHHEINQFCSKHTLAEVYIELFETLDEALVDALQRDCNKWAPGIQIIAIRVTKPKIPENIKKSYEQMEQEKTKLLIAEQSQKVYKKEAETKQMQAKIQAETDSVVAQIKMEQQLKEKENAQKIADIENKIQFEKAKSEADSLHYSQIKEIESNKARLTPEYLQLMSIISIANNTKIYFGPDLPSIFIENNQGGGDFRKDIIPFGVQEKNLEKQT